jgi:hypothetical protein
MEHMFRFNAIITPDFVSVKISSGIKGYPLTDTGCIELPYEEWNTLKTVLGAGNIVIGQSVCVVMNEAIK